ncbi:MAG: hypothetical protein PWP31_948 [Clostridia bacterium]|nr:hypothetical protein [Clostridia bacterium]
MKKVGLFLLTILVSLSMLTSLVLAGPSPVLAGYGKSVSHSASGRHSASGKHSMSGSHGVSKSPDKEKIKVKKPDKEKIKAKKKAENRIQTRLKNKSSKQKLEIRKRLEERMKQTVKREFKDTQKHWAKNDIQKVQNLGLIGGYPDGTFKPDAPVSSVEAMIMAVRMADILNTEDEAIEEEVTEEEVVKEEVEEEDLEEAELEEGELEEGEEEDISDVPDWAKDAARRAHALKIINLNRFHSHVQATRAQAAVMLAKALGMQPVEIDTSDITFSDAILISPEDVGYILALKEAGIIKGTPDGKFNPNSTITRAEIAAMLSRIVDAIEDDETTENEITDQATEPNENTDVQTNNENETTDQATQPNENTEDSEQASKSEATQDAEQPSSSEEGNGSE